MSLLEKYILLGIGVAALAQSAGVDVTGIAMDWLGSQVQFI